MLASRSYCRERRAEVSARSATIRANAKNGEKNARIDTIGANDLHNGGDHAWFFGKLYATR